MAYFTTCKNLKDSQIENCFIFFDFFSDFFATNVKFFIYLQRFSHVV